MIYILWMWYASLTQWLKCGNKTVKKWIEVEKMVRKWGETTIRWQLVRNCHLSVILRGVWVSFSVKPPTIWQASKLVPSIV